MDEFVSETNNQEDTLIGAIRTLFCELMEERKNVLMFLSNVLFILQTIIMS